MGKGPRSALRYEGPPHDAGKSFITRAPAAAAVRISVAVKTPGMGSSPSVERGLDHLRDEAGTDDEAGARVGCGSHLLRVHDGADADRPSLSGSGRDRFESAGRVDRHLDLLDPTADERGHCARDVTALVEAHDSDQRAGAEHGRVEHRPTLTRAML